MNFIYYDDHNVVSSFAFCSFKKSISDGGIFSIIGNHAYDSALDFC